MRENARPDQMRRFLRAQDWFGMLLPVEQTEVLGRASLECFACGEVIQRRRSANHYWYGVMEGRVELRLATDASRKYAPHVVPAGHWFGEDLSDTDGVALFEAVAVAACAIAALPSPLFPALMQANAEFCRYFAGVFWQRLAQIQHSVALCSGSREERVAAALINHCDEDVRNGLAWHEVNQAMLARQCGLSRQRANLSLRHLEQEGLVERGGRRIRILDRRGLETLAWQCLPPPIRTPSLQASSAAKSAPSPLPK